MKVWAQRMLWKPKKLEELAFRTYTIVHAPGRMQMRIRRHLGTDATELVPVPEYARFVWELAYDWTRDESLLLLPDIVVGSFVTDAQCEKITGVGVPACWDKLQEMMGELDRLESDEG